MSDESNQTTLHGFSEPEEESDGEDKEEISEKESLDPSQNESAASVDTINQDLLKKRMEEVEQDTGDKDWNDPEEINVDDETCCRFLAKRAYVTYSTGTLSGYESYIRLFANFLAERDISVYEASIEEVYDFFMSMARRGNRESTLDGKRAAIGKLYEYIELHEQIEPNVTYTQIRNIDTGAFNTPSSLDRSALSDQEITKLLDAVEQKRNRLIIIVSLATGARNGALRRLKIEDVDTDQNTILLWDEKNDEQYSVPLTDSVAVELEHWIDVGRYSYSTADSSPFVFPSHKGSKIKTKNTVSNIVAEAAERAGIQEYVRTPHPLSKSEMMEWRTVTTHTLRHTFNRRMKDAGIDIESRRDALNHSSVESTEQYDDGGTEYEDEIRNFIEPFLG